MSKGNGFVLENRIFDSRVKSKNVTGKEKRLGYLLGPFGALFGGSLTYAKGYYESIYGKISVDWKKEYNQIVFKIDVPANVEAKFKFINTTKELKPGENTIQVDL